jgi:hypothetical protein
MGKGFFIWNLPCRVTCPGKTEICSKKCYANKAERMYPNVRNSRMENFETSKLEDFADRMIRKIWVMQDENSSFAGFFRIHESGDFYSQKYLEDWKKICKEFPDIKFLAFTKSFHLDFNNIPENMQVIMSIFPDTNMENVPKGFLRAYAGDCKEMDNIKMLECPGNCDTCGMCWQLNKTGMNVHFKIH